MRSTAPEPIPRPPDPRLLADEISGLAARRILVDAGPNAVVLAAADEIPRVLYEIGRLREIAFRAVGEGTGGMIDLDEYDAHYRHLVLWNRERSEVVGAYRLGETDAILPRFGIDGLYTSTLFEYRMEFFARIMPALELGRAFVRLESQKSYSALFLLWKGIGEFIARHPWYRFLFGSVSISNEYRQASQRRVVEFLRESCSLPGLARFVEARNAVRWNAREVEDAPQAGTFEELEQQVRGLEGGRFGVPVLIKQYAKLGGRFLEFSRDPGFCDSLDGLVVVDLAHTPISALERYVGEAGLAAFLEIHAPRPANRGPIELP